MRIKSRFDSYNVIVPPEAHSEPSQTSKKEHLAKIVYCSVIVVWILNELSTYITERLTLLSTIENIDNNLLDLSESILIKTFSF